MKAFWLWLLGLFGIKPTTIPPEVIDDTTAHVDPEDFIPGEEIVDIDDDDNELSDEISKGLFNPLSCSFNSCVRASSKPFRNPTTISSKSMKCAIYYLLMFY